MEKSLIDYLKENDKYIAIVTDKKDVFLEFVNENIHLKDICIQIKNIDSIRAKYFFTYINLYGYKNVKESVRIALLSRIR